MIIEVEDLAHFEKILAEAGDKLVMVDFTAVWCGPCRDIGPKYKLMSEDPSNKNVIFLKVDVDEATDVTEKCGITCMPTFHLYRNKVLVEEFKGAHEAKLKELLEKNRS